MLIQLPGGTAIDPFGEAISAEDNGSIVLHTPLALSRLIERWKADSHPNLAGLLSAYTDAAQDAENVLWDVIVSRLIDYATNAQLDGLGRIVGEARNGLGDAAYRARIRARILINQSLGRASDIVKVLRAVDPGVFHLIEVGEAAFEIYYDAPLSNDAVAAQLPGIVRETRGAGIGATVKIPTDATRGARYGYAATSFNAHIGYGYAASGTYGGVYANATVA